MPGRIDAVIFDFDGLVLDTETVVYESWRRVYRAHGHDLPIEAWIAHLGMPSTTFDHHADIEQLADVQLDRDEVRQQRDAYVYATLDAYDALPGVIDWIKACEDMGLKRAVCSGSSHRWVERHLNRLGLLDRFQTIVCGEDTTEHKPEPAPFLETARQLDVEPTRCLVLEDSLNGIRAAKAAGMWAAAVPTEMTARLNFTEADRVIASLAEQSLSHLIASLEAGGVG